MSKKYLQIKKLFQRDFISKNYEDSLRADDFICPFVKECKVFKDKIPIYTSNFGEEKSTIMIIAEAPSATEGIGIFISKEFKNINKSNKSPLYFLKEFVEKYYNETPYFTDLVKCGVARQKEKKILSKRAKNCFDRYLIYEINIIKPLLIICVGNLAYDFIINAQNKSRISNKIKIAKIIHYSRRAGLPLNNKDKELIWKIQMGIINNEELGNIPITKLDYINSTVFKNNLKNA